MKMIAYTVTVIMQEDMPEEIVQEQLKHAVNAKFIKKTEPTTSEYVQYAQECNIMIDSAIKEGIWKTRTNIIGEREVGLTEQGKQCRKADLS